MKIKIQDIVYRANVREVREKIIRVADFAIPSDKIAASLATAAGEMLVGLAAGSWDVLAAPGTSGLSLVSDLTLAKKIKWAASTSAVNPILTNKSGGDLTAGSVVIKSGTASAFTTTTTPADKVIGVLGETIANNLPGSVLQVGLATVLVQGNVAIGDQLQASATAGRAQVATDGQGVFALAVTAYAGGGAGSVTALLFAVERVPAATDAVAGKVELATVAEVTTGTSATLVPSVDSLTRGQVRKFRGTISNPQAMYAQRPQVPLFRADAALTITRINVTNSVSDHETAGDLKWADDIFTGGFANATVIDVCDTTTGVFTATAGFDDATIASGKEVYFQFDSSPHTDIKDIRLEVWFTYD